MWYHGQWDNSSMKQYIAFVFEYYAVVLNTGIFNNFVMFFFFYHLQVKNLMYVIGKAVLGDLQDLTN